MGRPLFARAGITRRGGEGAAPGGSRPTPRAAGAHCMSAGEQGRGDRSRTRGRPESPPVAIHLSMHPPQPGRPGGAGKGGAETSQEKALIAAPARGVVSGRVVCSANIPVVHESVRKETAHGSNEDSWTGPGPGGRGRRVGWLCHAGRLRRQGGRAGPGEGRPGRRQDPGRQGPGRLQEGRRRKPPRRQPRGRSRPSRARTPR